MHAVFISLTALSLVLTGEMLARPSHAQAPPSTASVQKCEFYGRIASLAADLRDKGIDSSEVINYLNVQLRQTPRLQGTTEAGVARMNHKMTTTVLSVYAHPEMTPDRAKLATYQSCIDRSSDEIR